MTHQSYQTSGNKDIVVVKSLKKFFPVRAGVFQRVVANVQAVDDVSFTIKEASAWAWWVNPDAGRRPSGAPCCA